MRHNICFTFIVCFYDHVRPKTFLTISITSPTSNFLPTRCCHEVYILLGPCVSCVQVWVSSVTEITPDDLRVQDMDSPPEDLRYMVTPPSNGHLALKSAPMQAVYNFTQKYIDQGQLLFVHKGKIRVSNPVKKVKQISDFLFYYFLCTVKDEDQDKTVADVWEPHN